MYEQTKSVSHVRYRWKRTSYALHKAICTRSVLDDCWARTFVVIAQTAQTSQTIESTQLHLIITLLHNIVHSTPDFSPIPKAEIWFFRPSNCGWWVHRTMADKSRWTAWFARLSFINLCGMLGCISAPINTLAQQEKLQRLPQCNPINCSRFRFSRAAIKLHVWSIQRRAPTTTNNSRRTEQTGRSPSTDNCHTNRLYKFKMND